ncbi:MAG: GAP family protein [Actinomycetota bacterium]|nr:GAP family protein [Actinomycetota bacterium]
MLSQAIGELLPYAVGVALSPIPIIAVILMLDTPKARSNGPAFALGWIVGLTAAAVIVLLISGGASDADSTASDSVSWAQLAIGLLFLAMARRQWSARPKDGAEPTMPKWMATIDQVNPVKALGLGVLLSGINPKNLALAAAAGAALAQAGLDAGGDALGIAVFVVLGSVTVVGAVLFYLVAPRAASGPLGSIKTFMSEHNSVIMMVILLLLGAKLIGSGLGVLDS